MYVNIADINIRKINYFKNSNYGTKILLNDKYVYYKYSAKHFLNQLCLMNLATIESYNKGLKSNLNFKYLNPYYLRNIILIQIGNINKYETIWINYNNINNYIIKDKKTIVEFHSKYKLTINKNIKYFNNQREKINKIKRYLCNL